MRKNVHLPFLGMVIIIGILLNACANKIDMNMSEQMVDFEFITQDNKPLSLDDLKGDWWIAYLSYTNCRTVCPRTTAHMVNVQNELKEIGLFPHIISFNVDPANDKPEDLKAYADQYGVDLSTWDFLTGYDFQMIRELSNISFKAVLEDGAVGQMSHSYMFYLINPEGKVVKKYNGMSMDELDLLIDDVQTVLK